MRSFSLAVAVTALFVTVPTLARGETLGAVKEDCRAPCRLEVGPLQPVGAQRLAAVRRSGDGRDHRFLLHGDKLVPLPDVAAYLATLPPLPSIEAARALGRVMLALRVGDPAAAIYTNPEELARLATPLRRRVDRDHWPRTDPRDGGRAIVSAIVHWQRDGKTRLDRLVLLVAPTGFTALAAGEVLHCEPGFPGGCELLPMP